MSTKNERERTQNKPKMVNAPEGLNQVFFRNVEGFDLKNAIFAKAFDRKSLVIQEKSFLESLLWDEIFLV